MKIKLKKGLDINVSGAITDLTVTDIDTKLYAVNPDDFPGFKPKVDVKEGDSVMAGAPLMHDKTNTDLKLVSPVAGTIRNIIRGERRKIIHVIVEASDSKTARRFDIPANPDQESVMRLLAESGLLAEIRQRPYDIVPAPNVMPRDIFVTAIDSAPLAVSPELFVADKTAELAAAVKLLKTICDGKIYISVRQDSQISEIEGATLVEVIGPHPAGNAGVQAANIAPVNKGETVWTLDIVTLARIGTLVINGVRDCTTVVGICGPEVASPALIKTYQGAAIAPLLADHLKPSDHHVRIISGNVLSGIAELPDGFLHYPYRQLSVIAEGDDKSEFMGWASFAPSKASESPTFPGHFLHRAFCPDARLNGSRRAMIMSGQYDRVIPMDILPEYLIKAIISHNIDDMEKLGIYEVAPEDFSAAEYVDTSKIPLQQIVREGLEYMRQALE